MIDPDAPWLPCWWSGDMPTRCPHCHLPEAAWEGRLRRSEGRRRAQRSEAERILRNAVWSAA